MSISNFQSFYLYLKKPVIQFVTCYRSGLRQAKS